jgi:hypothetical protein
MSVRALVRVLGINASIRKRTEVHLWIRDSKQSHWFF